VNVLSTYAPPVALILNDGDNVPAEVVGKVIVLQPMVVSADAQSDYVIPVPPPDS